MGKPPRRAPGHMPHSSEEGTDRSRYVGERYRSERDAVPVFVRRRTYAGPTAPSERGRIVRVHGSEPLGQQPLRDTQVETMARVQRTKDGLPGAADGIQGIDPADALNASGGFSLSLRGHGKSKR